MHQYHTSIRRMSQRHAIHSLRGDEADQAKRQIDRRRTGNEGFAVGRFSALSGQRQGKSYSAEELLFIEGPADIIRQRPDPSEEQTRQRHAEDGGQSLVNCGDAPELEPIDLRPGPKRPGEDFISAAAV